MKRISSIPPKEIQMPVILAVSAAVVLLIFLFIIFGRDSGDEERLARIEIRLEEVSALRSDMQALAERVNRVESRDPAFETDTLISRMDRLENTVSQRLGAVENQLDQLEDEAAGAADSGSTGPRASTAASTPAAESKPDVPTIEKKVNIKKTRPRYHTVADGETLYQISRKYDVSVEELKRMNSLGPEMIIKPGQRLVVGSK